MRWRTCWDRWARRRTLRSSARWCARAAAWDGSYAYALGKTGGANADRWGARYNLNVTAGATYCVSCRVRLADVVNSTNTNAQLYASSGGATANATTSVLGEWMELSFSITAAAATLSVYAWLYNCDAGTLYLDAVQVTQTAAVQPFWGGARTAGTLSYAAVPVTWARCTIMGWFRLEDQASAYGGALHLCELRVDGNNRYDIYVTTGNKLQAALVAGGTTATATSATSVTARDWHHWALVVSNRTATLYLDGVAVTPTATAPGLVSGMATLWVGCYGASGGSGQLNGMIDDLAVVNNALTGVEVRAVYESNAPVFAESSVWSFRATPKGLVWADDEGLWMRDVVGNPVLGIYGGEAETKSWAGWADMAAGDVIIGRNVVGAAALRWTQATGKFGFFGGGNATPQVEIGTDGRITAINADLSGAITATSGSIAGLLSIGASGEIRQGTGTLGTNFTGLRVWQSGNVGLIGGYNNNLLQWYADTDGSLHAGAGVLAIGLAGIQIAVPASWTNVNGYQFVLSPYTLSAGLFAQYISGDDRMYTRQQTLSPDFTTVTVSSLAQNTKGVGGFASNDMAATAGTTTAIIELFADRAGGVGSARIAANVLKLENLTANTGAVGTYAGKVKINIGGTDVWIPYYSS